MNYWLIFFSVEYFFTLFFISLLYPIAFWIVGKLEDAMTDQPVSHFLLESFGQPVLQALLALLFIYLAYPKLFGVDGLPDLFSVLTSNNKSLDDLINILLLLGFFLPAVPVLWGFRGMILALQVIIVSQVIFLWSLKTIKIPVVIEFIPEIPFIIQLLIAVLFIHKIIAILGEHLGKWLDDQFETNGMDMLIEMSAGFFLQGFVILTYTLFLGNQMNL